MKKSVIALVLAVLVIGAGLFVWLRGRPAPAPPPTAAPASLRSLEQGELVGTGDSWGGHVWRGVPFAQPPVGALRWKAPRPPRPWSGRLEALANGNLCPQLPSLLSGAGESPDSEGPVGDEDCLFLNVFAPAFEPEAVPAGPAALPVMVWIHGGGNSIGHGGSYDGGALATRHQLVVVSINYRLGPLGWLRHPALATGDPADDSGNYGTLDAVRALEWVRDNIAAFGGNPGRVTIFGESAGGADVLAMMASPLAQGLFHGAVVQSGGLYLTPVARAENYVDAAEPGHPASGREIANLLLAGPAGDRDAGRAAQEQLSDAEVAKRLLEASPAEILSRLDGGSFGMVRTPKLFADGHVLPLSQATELFVDPRHYNAVPVILGTNRDEPKLFMVRSPEWVENRFGFLPRLKDEAAYLRYARYGSLASKVRGVDGLAEILRESQGPSVFAYRFDWDEERSLMGYDLSVALGAAHGLEIAFVFGAFEGGLGLSYIYDPDRLEARDALSDSMMSYWAEFAYSGNPGQGRDGSEVAWLPWETSGKTMIVFDTEEDGGIRMSDERVNLASLERELATDASFVDQRRHCELYARYIWGSDHWDGEEFAGLGKAGCAEYDPKELAGF